MTLTTKYFPIDAFLISGHMHMGAGASRGLMYYLQHHPSVRSFGMATYHDSKGYDEQALEYISQGKVNTMFIDPGNTGDYLSFDAAPYIKKIRSEFPNVVFVIYTWDRCWEKFTEIHPEFLHYFYLDHVYYSENKKSNLKLNIILDECQHWFKTRYDYDIAISFASEDRQLAEGVASGLKKAKARVFYDKDEQAHLLGKNLYDCLYDIYCNRSRYCIVISSISYTKKMWTTHERQAAQERTLAERGNEYIIPVRVDDTHLPGLSKSIAYINATDGVEKIVKLIIQKLWVTKKNLEKKYIGKSLY